MEFSENEYLTAVYSFDYFGPARTKLLLSYFKSAKNIWHGTRPDLVCLGLRVDVVERFLEYRKKFNIEGYFEKLKALNIHITTILDKNYPENLKNLEDAPSVLYIKGEIKKSDSASVAIVGTRMMTSYGREVATKFAGELASFGITVISGLALGVDAQAQKSALAAGGRTISVLASGLNIITPSANRAIAEDILKGNGAIVSEYPIGHIPKPFEFPVRDRLISGLAKAVIVIEGRMKSGTFHTVRAAADQGRPVFAVPGPITSPASEGPNYLIQNGVKLVTNVKEVLEELDLQTKVDREVVESVMPASSDEEKLLGFLEVEPLHLDELVRISGCGTAELSARLTIMEMKGMIRNLGKGVYKKT